MKPFTSIARLATHAIFATLSVCFFLSASPVAAQTTTGSDLTGATGQGLFTSKGCSGCHAATSSTKANAIKAGGEITYANTFHAMGAPADAGGEYANIGEYFKTLFPDLGTQSVAFETALPIAIPNIVLNSSKGDYVGLRQVTAPSRGATAFTLGSTTMTYTPNTGQCGSDSFTYEAYRTINGNGTSNLRTVSLTIANPSAPDISTSSGTPTGTVGSAFTYTPVSTGGTPTSYTITFGTLPAGLSLAPATGIISGTPTAQSNTTVTLSAFNCLNGTLTGQSGTKSITFTIITVPGAPTIGTATAGNAQISVAFTAPGSNGGSAITGYTATCSGISITGAGSPVVVTGLTNGTAYTCTVVANNAAGSSVASAASNSVTPATFPGAPTIGTATAGNMQASIAFAAPVSSGGSAITGYNATCTPSGNGSNTVSPINIVGLTNGVTYTCSVTAANAVGPGPASGSVMVTPALVVPPGAPTIGTATPGDTQATITFTPPGFDGGGAIIDYTATCTPSGSGTNAMSPVTVTGLVNGTAYSCSVTARNSAGSGPASATVNVTPLPALALVSVVSRKTHGGTGSFDIAINSTTLIGGLVDVEPRTIGGGHTLVFTFNNPITAAGNVGVIDSASAMVGSATSTSAGNDVVVTLTGIPDNQRVTVTLTNVNGVATAFPVSLGFLVGDVNNTRSVNSSDISGVKARSGQTTTSLNFNFDVNTTGAVNSSDISAVKARSGLTLPP